MSRETLVFLFLQHRNGENGGNGENGAYATLTPRRILQFALFLPICYNIM